MKVNVLSRTRLSIILLLLIALLVACSSQPEEEEAVPTEASPAEVEETSPEPTEAPEAEVEAETEAETETEAEAETEAETDMTSAEISENIGVYAVPAELVTFDPAFVLGGEGVVIANVYDKVTHWDPVANEVVPMLAESWESNEDGTEWTFHLREGVTFHDGSSFTANDVKVSLERNIGVGLVAYNFIGVDTIEVVDDLTVKFICSEPRNVPLILSGTFGSYIYSAAAADKDIEWFLENDAGTGPYTISSIEPSAQIVTDYYPEYWGGWEEGQFTKVIYEIVEDPTVREQMIRAGEADVTVTLPLISLDSLDATDGVDVTSYDPNFHMMAIFDLSNEPLDNQLVRQALAASFPYEDVHEGVFLGMGQRGMGMGPSFLWDMPDDFPKHEYDLEKAAALLEEAGYGDGFELNLATYVGFTELSDVATIWQASLAEIGVQLNVEQLTLDAFWQNIFNPDNTETDIFLPLISGDMPSSWGWMVPFSSSPYGWMPVVGYSNPEYDEALFSAWTTEATDPAAATPDWITAQTILYEDVPSLSLMDVPEFFIHGDNLEGLVANPNYPLTIFWHELKRQ